MSTSIPILNLKDRADVLRATVENTLEIVTRIVGTYCPGLLRSFAVFWKESTFAGRKGTSEEVSVACEKVGIPRSAVAETKEEAMHRAWVVKGEKTRRHIMEVERKKKEEEERKKEEKKKASEKLKAVEQQKMIERVGTEEEAKERRRKKWEERKGTGREFGELFRTNEGVERFKNGESSKTAEGSVKTTESATRVMDPIAEGMKTKVANTMRMRAQRNLDKQNSENAAKATANITDTKDATDKDASLEDTIMTDDKPIHHTTVGKSQEVKGMVMSKLTTGTEHPRVYKGQEVGEAQKMDKAQKVENVIKFNTAQKANKTQTIATTQKIGKAQPANITTSDVTQTATSPKTTEKGTMPTITSTITKSLEKVSLTLDNNKPTVACNGTKQGDGAEFAATQKDESSSPLSSVPSALSESPESRVKEVIIKTVQKRAMRSRKAAPIPTRRSTRSAKKVFLNLATDGEDNDEELEESLDDDDDDNDDDEVDVIKVDGPRSYTTKVPTKPSADSPPGAIEEPRGRRLRSHDTPPAENLGVVSARAKANETPIASRGHGNWKKKTPSCTDFADTAVAIKTPATRSHKNSVVDESSVDTATAAKMPVTPSRRDSLVSVATVITATKETVTAKTVTTKTTIALKTPATKSRKRSSPHSYPADDHPTSAVSITNTLKRRVAQHKKGSPQDEQRRLSIEKEKFLDPTNYSTGLMKPTAPPKKRRKSKDPVDGKYDEADGRRLSGSSSKSGSSELSSLEDSQGISAKENSHEGVAKENASREVSQETTKHNTRSRKSPVGETENTKTSKVPTKTGEPVGKCALRHSVRTRNGKTPNPEDVGKTLPKKGIPAAESGNLTQDEPDTKPTETVTKTPAANKNGRVTRQKALAEDSEVEDQIVLASSENIVTKTATPAPKGRGCPGKAPVVATETSTTDSVKLKLPPSSNGKRKREQSVAEDLHLSINGQTSGDNEESESQKQEFWKARKTRGNNRKPREM